MTRLIDADAFKKQFSGEEHYWALKIIDMIDNAPTVPLPDFKEGYKQAIADGKTNYSRPKGEWIDLGYALEEYRAWGKCSVCGDGMFQSDFCPNCGAEMRGGQDNDPN